MNDGKIFVSVLVAVYNGEDCLDRCVKSILSQTYKNLEIIFVDDGSTDSSPQILDNYAKQDTRIKVIHKPNGGLADARNTGIRASAGRYISFIDMDDWVEPDMISLMLDNLLDYGAQMVICSYSRDYNKNNPCHIVDEKKIYTGQEALGKILDGTFESFAWNKLYDRTLFEEILFPKAISYEDIAIMYRLVESSSKVVVLPDILYHYVHRKNSIVATRKLVDLFMRINSEIERYQYVMKRGYTEYSESALLTLLNSYRPLMVASIFTSHNERKKYYTQRKKYDAFLKTHFNRYVKKQNLNTRIQYYFAVKGMFVTDVLALICEGLNRIFKKVSL